MEAKRTVYHVCSLRKQKRPDLSDPGVAQYLASALQFEQSGGNHVPQSRFLHSLEYCIPCIRFRHTSMSWYPSALYVRSAA